MKMEKNEGLFNAHFFHNDAPCKTTLCDLPSKVLDNILQKTYLHWRLNASPKQRDEKVIRYLIFVSVCFNRRINRTRFKKAEYRNLQGTAVQVIVAENDRFVIKEEELGKILLDPRIKESHVIVVSIAGAYRTGKSFILNFFLRYLQSKGSENWIHDPEARVEGFSWKGGDVRCTTGILMWSEPLEVTLSNGEKAWVLLMDTQGAFDSESTVKDCATVFALSTLLSSVQVYNIMKNIQEDHLQHLQFFTEYGRLAAEANRPKDNALKDNTMDASKPKDISEMDSTSKDSRSIHNTSESTKAFQELYFLVRDWQFLTSYEYGWKGGAKYIASKLGESQRHDMKALRQHIRSCFANIGCFLMPYPGTEVTTGLKYDGRLKDIDVNFQLHVNEFVRSLLLPDKLVVKEIDGKKITGGELFEYFKTCANAFQVNNALPDLKSIFEVTAELNHRDSVSKAADKYTTLMDKVCGDKNKYVETTTLESKHNAYQKEVIELFQSVCKMGGEIKIGESQEQLKQKIKKLYEEYKKDNHLKKVTIELNHRDAISKATDKYTTLMDKVCGDKNRYVETTTLENTHSIYQKMVIDLFQSICNTGGEIKIGESKEQLKQKIKKLYEDYKKDNNLKKVNIELNHRDAVSKATGEYTKLMDKVCGDKKKYVETTTLESNDNAYQKEAIKLFQSMCTMGGKTKIRESQGQLEKKIQKLYEDYKKDNWAKKVIYNEKRKGTALIVAAAGFTVAGVVAGAGAVYTGLGLASSAGSTSMTLGNAFIHAAPSVVLAVTAGVAVWCAVVFFNKANLAFGALRELAS